MVPWSLPSSQQHFILLCSTIRTATTCNSRPGYAPTAGHAPTSATMPPADHWSTRLHSLADYTYFHRRPRLVNALQSSDYNSPLPATIPPNGHAPPDGHSATCRLQSPYMTTCNTHRYDTTACLLLDYMQSVCPQYKLGSINRASAQLCALLRGSTAPRMGAGRMLVHSSPVLQLSRCIY